MRHDIPTEESQEMAALYALGALSQHEARAFEIHLREGCEVCQREFNEFAGVVDIMSSGAPQIAPPAYLRDLLNARIEKEVRLSSTEAPAEAQVYRFQEIAQQPRPIASRRSPLRGLLPWAIAASLLAAFAFTLIRWQTDHRQLQTMAKQQADSQQQLADLREQLAHDNTRAKELEQINSVLDSPQGSVIALAGLEAAPLASGKIYWDHQKNRWVVTANLPPAPAGKVYQLWFVTPEAKVSAGLIEPDPLGHGFVTLDVPPGINQIQAAAITLEPAGGSPQPTMPIYVLGKAS